MIWPFRKKQHNAPPRSIPELCPAARSTMLAYVIVATAATWLLANQLFQNALFSELFSIVFICSIVLCLFRLGALGVLSVVQAAFFLSEDLRTMEYDFAGVLWKATLALVLIISAYRLQFLLTLHQLSLMSALRQAWRRLFKPEESSTRPTPLLPTEALTLGLGTLVSIIVATTVLGLVPESPDSLRRFGLVPSGLRLIQLAFIGVVTYALLAFFVKQVIWRRSTPPMARAYLLSTLVSWFIVDGRSIASRTQKFRKQRSRKDHLNALQTKQSRRKIVSPEDA